MGTPYLNNKSDTVVMKDFVKPKAQNKVVNKSDEKVMKQDVQKGNPFLPVRGQ